MEPATILFGIAISLHLLKEFWNFFQNTREKRTTSSYMKDLKQTLEALNKNAEHSENNIDKLKDQIGNLTMAVRELSIHVKHLQRGKDS